jgi:catechol 2,3-dioxygenase-like lactoylglutathione lyase family enzyme
MHITKLDHLVLTSKDINASIKFYTTVLGMKLVSFENNRKSLRFGSQKINLHQYGEEIKPHAAKPTPGSADLCFITETPLDQVIKHIIACGQIILDGPVNKTGAQGPLLSIYLRDPDNNLIEIANRAVDQT